MCHYQHLSTTERENLLELLARGKSIRAIARELNRSASTISRELKRNRSKSGKYSPSKATKRYQSVRKKCGRKRILKDAKKLELVRELIQTRQWSPEQVAKTLRRLGIFPISYRTIYHAIHSKMFETHKLSPSEKGFRKHLRHKGKPRKGEKYKENRGKLKPPLPWELLPEAAVNRTEPGWYEADTVRGNRTSGGLVVLVDRMTRFVLCRRVLKFTKEAVADAIIEMLRPLPKHMRRGLLPDQGKEFYDYERISAELDDLPIFFVPPHSPWLKPSVENTNGLIREYFPKGSDTNDFSDAFVQDFVDRINDRPRKCHNWLSNRIVFECAISFCCT